MWYTDNNNNYVPPVNLSSIIKSYLDAVSIGVERASGAQVFDKYGFMAQIPFSNTVPIPRLDYTPTNGKQPRTPDLLLEDTATNVIGDNLGSGSGYIKERNPNGSTSLEFQGLVDPLGKQFAVSIFWQGGSAVNTNIDKPFSQTPANFDVANFGLSAYIKQNSSPRYQTGSSNDNKRMISARYFAMRIKATNGRFLGWVWDWQTKQIQGVTSHGQKIDLVVEKAPNGWYRCGIQGEDDPKISSGWVVEYGYVEPDIAFTGGWRFGPNTQYSLNGLWFGLQLESGNINGNITSLIWAPTSTNFNTRAVELANARGHSNVEQYFEAIPNGAILFMRFKYPHRKGVSGGDAKVGVSLFNAGTGTDANFIGFVIGSGQQIRGIVKRNGQNEAFFGKSADYNDFYLDNKYGGVTPKYISVALVFNKEYTEFYVNGQQIGTTDTSSKPPNWQGNNAQLGIVFRTEFTKNKFFGRINEFSIYHTQGIPFAEQSALAKKLTKNENPLKP